MIKDEVKLYLRNTPSIYPTLDATEKAKVADYYDNYVKIPVPVSIDETIFEKSYDGERYSEFYLYNYDSVFREVLKQNVRTI